MHNTQQFVLFCNIVFLFSDTDRCTAIKSNNIARGGKIGMSQNKNHVTKLSATTKLIKTFGTSNIVRVESRLRQA